MLEPSVALNVNPNDPVCLGLVDGVIVNTLAAWLTVAVLPRDPEVTAYDQVGDSNPLWVNVRTVGVPSVASVYAEAALDTDAAADVIVEFDGSKLTNELFNEFIKKLPFIIEETNELGQFNLGIFDISIVSLTPIDMIKPHFKNVF